MRPFPQYQQIQAIAACRTTVKSTYHVLRASLQRRFRSGTNLQVSYTWSKNITNSDTIVLNTNNLSSIQDPTNLKGEKSLSTQDLPNVFVTSFIQELPFGRKPPLFQSWNYELPRRWLAGWSSFALPIRDANLVWMCIIYTRMG
ncbi:hypothetical protein BDD14_3964 [Edaphobacter modestus]|uniref:TonB-dependent transporter Oar-like beta-barrel domain-containing protein n=1 Tax=Edaphobacter modestus TaxID=388466 RepID=A0A4Q7YYW2_9BACT|nr:hypothetical protein BDD14_3964 [Edaphobacter modestus]